MALYAIGDLHLSLGTNKPMDVFGGNWTGHIDKIKEEKYNSFSAGPILAYFLARENEIKTVRIILTGKLNNLSDDFIRERLRKMYV